jgi:hypothetical protein
MKDTLSYLNNFIETYRVELIMTILLKTAELERLGDETINIRNIGISRDEDAEINGIPMNQLSSRLLHLENVVVSQIGAINVQREENKELRLIITRLQGTIDSLQDKLTSQATLNGKIATTAERKKSEGYPSANPKTEIVVNNNNTYRDAITGTRKSKIENKNHQTQETDNTKKTKTENKNRIRPWANRTVLKPPPTDSDGYITVERKIKMTTKDRVLKEYQHLLTSQRTKCNPIFKNIELKHDAFSLINTSLIN